MDDFEKYFSGNNQPGSDTEQKAENVSRPAADETVFNTHSDSAESVFAADEKAQSQPKDFSTPVYQGAETQHNTFRDSGVSGVGNSATNTPPAYTAPTPTYTWNPAPAQPTRPAQPAAPIPQPQSSYSTGYAPAQAAPKPAKKKSGAGKIALILVAAFIISIVGGAIGSGISKGASGSTGNAVIYQSETKTASDTDSTGSKTTANTVESVAESTAASVVEVTTSIVQRGSFFGDYVTSGAGSGVIISADGYIVTNNHVIEDAEEIKVTLKSGKEYKATLVGTDDKTDIAVLKIDATGLTPATFGDSSAAAVGEQIIVIGNPLGSLGGSVTTGIISAKDREIEIENMAMTLLQIDAAVNPGNSGGALFNLNGELIGIVNAKYSSEEVEGLGFAIPINTAKSTIEDIIEYGYVKGRAQLGITAVEIKDLQTAISAGVTELGVYVYSVNDGSGAEKAGLQAGDRIVKIDDQEIDSYSTLSKLLDGKEVGDTVQLTYSRNGQQSTVSVKLIEYKPSTDNTKTKQN